MHAKNEEMENTVQLGACESVFCHAEAFQISRVVEALSALQPTGERGEVPAVITMWNAVGGEHVKHTEGVWSLQVFCLDVAGQKCLHVVLADKNVAGLLVEQSDALRPTSVKVHCGEFHLNIVIA